jgi:hypothetical protein
MPKRSVSWGVLLFSFAMISLAYTPKDSGWGWSFNWTYHVPEVNIPVLGYQIMGGIAVVISLFLVFSAFWEKWSDDVEKYIMKKLHYLLFVIYWITYLLGYIRGIGSLVLNANPNWIVDTAFSIGFILFLLVPILYFKWLRMRWTPLFGQESL